MASALSRADYPCTLYRPAGIAQQDWQLTCLCQGQVDVLQHIERIPEVSWDLVHVLRKWSLAVHVQKIFEGASTPHNRVAVSGL